MGGIFVTYGARAAIVMVHGDGVDLIRVGMGRDFRFFEAVMGDKPCTKT